jgi:hypothetical protein
MSFIEVKPNSPFTYNNLPYGVFSTADKVSQRKQIMGVAAGEICWAADLKSSFDIFFD